MVVPLGLVGVARTLLVLAGVPDVGGRGTGRPPCPPPPYLALPSAGTSYPRSSPPEYGASSPSTGWHVLQDVLPPAAIRVWMPGHGRVDPGPSCRCICPFSADFPCFAIGVPVGRPLLNGVGVLIPTPSRVGAIVLLHDFSPPVPPGLRLSAPLRRAPSCLPCSWVRDRTWPFLVRGDPAPTSISLSPSIRSSTEKLRPCLFERAAPRAGPPSDPGGLIMGPAGWG